MVKKRLFLFLLLAISSCNYFETKVSKEAVARVGTNYLYKNDIEGLVPSGTSKEDSTIIISGFINRWAGQKLLIKAAELNLSDEKKASYKDLINQYQVDLYTRGYMEEVVKQSVDTIINDNELKAYYERNKDNFRTNGILVQLRYINIPKDHPKFETIQDKFLNFKTSDKKFWDTYQLQLKNSALNDSVWVEMNQIYKKLPFINPDNRTEFITPGISFQHPDGNTIYFVKVKNTIDKNEVSPFEYIKPTLKLVILNRRKLELIKKFEKEITDDAIKNKEYEIYK